MSLVYAGPVVIVMYVTYPKMQFPKNSVNITHNGAMKLPDGIAMLSDVSNRATMCNNFLFFSNRFLKPELVSVTRPQHSLCIFLMLLISRRPGTMARRTSTQITIL